MGDICPSQGVCTEAGMYALRERRVHVTQEDFEMAVAKVSAVGEAKRGGHKVSWVTSAGAWELWGHRFGDRCHCERVVPKFLSCE